MTWMHILLVLVIAHHLPHVIVVTPASHMGNVTSL